MHQPQTTGPEQSREASIAVARRAVDLGVTLIDTAHLYGWGANEELLAEALHPYPDDLLIATKVGVAPPNPPHDAAICGRPDFLRDQVEQGLRRLRGERLDRVQP
ncbi:aldo/keto reductase [Streptosporangium album]|uniref:aldo/keto reductase n=1 Tax=Streptosporangium album TaxID=47479 RepID=UPI0028AD2D60|nr:aldo/keto reductase [Streptosporangium album]